MDMGTTMATGMARTRRSRPDRGGGAAIDWPGLVRIALRAAPILLLAALLFTITLRSSIADAFQAGRPDWALSWRPDHAGASAAMAHRLIAAGRIEDGRRMAERAIGRDPVQANAYSALALAAESAGHAARATRLMAVAHALSRRERVTEMWLIRQSIRSADYPAAVRHFDIAMRTSARRSADLMPLLVVATQDARLVPALAPVLARDPNWKAPFLMNLAINGPNAVHAARLSRGRLDPGQPEERAVLARLIARLDYERRYDLAWSFYREARPGTPELAASSLRDSEFAGVAGFPPFDWQLTEQADLTALRERRRDGGPGFALALLAEGGRTGEVARQLVRLSPGTYQIQFDAGAIPANPLDRPRISLLCAGTMTPFAQLRPGRAGEATQRVSGSFTVPPTCRWQLLSISIGSNETPVEIPWIAAIAIRRSADPRG